MSIQRGSTDYEYNNHSIDNGYDYYLIFILFVIAFWFINKI